MSYLRFDKTLMINLQESLPREILRTNRSGAYHCTTIVDCNTRKYHGLLVIPVPNLDDENHVLLSSLDETVIQHGAEFNLGLHKYQGNHFSPNGHKYIREFDCENIPTTTYRVGGVILRKEKIFVHHENRILIRYTLVDAHSATTLRFRPFLAFRSVYSLMAVTDEKYFNEDESYTVAVPKEQEALKQHIAFNYPQWKIVDYDSFEDAADMIANEEADCFLMGASQAMIYDNSQKFRSIPLTKTMEACFAVRDGEGTLLSILNKTLKVMPSDMLTSALAIYDSTADKVTFWDFVKDNMIAFFVAAGFFALSIISIILVLLRKARKAESVAKLAANDTKKLNDKLENALKKAEAASLAKTCFLNNMSHDIRTPMNAILGYAQLMEDELKGKDLPETSEHLEKLQQSGNLLLSIINNVLDMARIESGRMEIDENYARIENIRQTLFEIFDDEAKKKNLALHYTINVEHEHILTDTTKVKEIFVNILSNAIKYTPSGGSVTINVDELICDEPGYMIVRTRVSDTGIGMSQDYQTKIFDAFTRERNTTMSKITGSGLGMPIVKKYVDLLGGTIDVKSEFGKGSTFTVTLKHRIADEGYYTEKHVEELETDSGILEGRNILLAEDNDLNAEIAEAILERAGLKIERVEDGIQCVNQIMEMPAGTYDMILMDIQMPKMDGYKATQAIRNLPDKDKACIPIIAMTANAFEEDKRDAIEAGMNGHVAKPIQVDKLLSTLVEITMKQ